MANRRSPPQTRPDGCAFYAAVLEVLNGSGVPFQVGGSHATGFYIGLPPNTKDIDVFCLARDYPKLIRAGVEAGYVAEVEDERWIAKLRNGEEFCDVIFGSANLVTPVTEAWFTERHEGEICGVNVRLVPPTELIWSKAFIMDRNRFDGNMIAQVILKQHERIDWNRLLGYMEQHWEVLLFHLLRFRYVYPSERDTIPAAVLDELLSRLADQRTMPRPQRRACRGRLFSRDDFDIDITRWGFADAVGDHKQP
ncbi:MAG TPA: nucleotidyltransferase [Phycisphaerales bacterium]|nr:nucleotidyltransferase [Phycisphaerales bacterium]